MHFTWHIKVHASRTPGSIHPSIHRLSEYCCSPPPPSSTSSSSFPYYFHYYSYFFLSFLLIETNASTPLCGYFHSRSISLALFALHGPTNDIFIVRLLVFLFRAARRNEKKMRTLKSYIYILRNRQCVRSHFLGRSAALRREEKKTFVSFYGNPNWRVRRKTKPRGVRSTFCARANYIQIQTHTHTLIWSRDAVTILFYRHIVAERWNAFAMHVAFVGCRCCLTSKANCFNCNTRVQTIHLCVCFFLLVLRISMPLLTHKWKSPETTQTKYRQWMVRMDERKIFWPKTEHLAEIQNK